MSVGRFLQQAAAGNAGEAVYVDDVFSTYLYDGTGSAQTITNGIDLDGEGGLVWIKQRNSPSAAAGHAFIDTERGAGKALASTRTDAEFTTTTSGSDLTSFNSNGFSLGPDQYYYKNQSSGTYCSWTFRKQPGFFDVVTYTGDGTNDQAISHNLGSVPGMIIVKARDQSDSWYVYHRSLGTGKLFRLNSTAAASTSADKFDVAPTSTEFYVGYDGGLNGSGNTFVAYLFAHDDQSFGTGSDEAIIKCGSFTTDGSGNAAVDVGFEPQWILIKKTNSTGSWGIMDSMRGFTYDGTNKFLFPDLTNAETDNSLWDIRNNGFNLNGGGASNTFIYVAIRRPHKPAEEFAATDLFTPQTTLTTTTTGLARYQPGHLVDMVIAKATGAGFYGETSSRLTQGKYLNPDQTFAETSDAWYAFDYNDGFGENGAGSAYTSNSVHYMFRRAPGFFDVVTYTGDSSSPKTINHNLGVAPELIILKPRSVSGSSWNVTTQFDATSCLARYGALNNTQTLLSRAYGHSDNYLNSQPTATQLEVRTPGYDANQGNTNNVNYIMYLFASTPGISKVGSYSGTGSDVNVNCGFTSGARFVLVKRTDSTGDWYLWDSERGIVAGNDPYLLLNSTAAQVTSTDYIDPLSSGFTITSTAPAALNASGGTYIFLAIA
jgi:hypothetical protein